MLQHRQPGRLHAEYKYIKNTKISKALPKWKHETENIKSTPKPQSQPWEDGTGAAEQTGEDTKTAM